MVPLTFSRWIANDVCVGVMLGNEQLKESELVDIVARSMTIPTDKGNFKILSIKEMFGAEYANGVIVRGYELKVEL